MYMRARSRKKNHISIKKTNTNKVTISYPVVLHQPLPHGPAVSPQSAWHADILPCPPLPSVAHMWHFSRPRLVLQMHTRFTLMLATQFYLSWFT